MKGAEIPLAPFDGRHFTIRQNELAFIKHVRQIGAERGGECCKTDSQQARKRGTSLAEARAVPARPADRSPPPTRAGWFFFQRGVPTLRPGFHHHVALLLSFASPCLPRWPPGSGASFLRGTRKREESATEKNEQGKRIRKKLLASLCLSFFLSIHHRHPFAHMLSLCLSPHARPFYLPYRNIK